MLISEIKEEYMNELHVQAKDWMQAAKMKREQAKAVTSGREKKLRLRSFELRSLNHLSILHEKRGRNFFSVLHSLLGLLMSWLF